MSWQKLAETASRLGIPCLIPGADGGEPMVLLPLSEYEQLRTAGREGIGTSITSNPESDARRPNPVTVSDPSPQLSEFAQKLEKTAKSTSEMTLEDRFFFDQV